MTCRADETCQFIRQIAIFMLVTLDMLIFVSYNLHMNSIGAAPLVDAVRSNGCSRTNRGGEKP